MIEIQDVHIENDARVLISGISTILESKGMMLFVGEDKLVMHSLLSAICGIRNYEKGSILIDGYKAGTLEAKKRISCVFEKSLMNPFLTPRENLTFYLQLRGLNSETIDRGLYEYSRRLLVHEWLDKKVGTLSQGIARELETLEAFIAKPAYFVLSDLTSHFTEIYLHSLPIELRTLIQKGTAVISSTQSIELVRLISRILPVKPCILHKGQIVAVRKGEKLMESLPSEIIASLAPEIGIPENSNITRAIEAFSKALQQA